MKRVGIIALSSALVCMWASHVDAQSLESPRLQALQDAVQQRSSDVVDSFWKEIETTGGPLIERSDDDPSQVLVTFLWRGGPDTKHVLVLGQIGQLTGTRRADNQMARLGNTSVWYRSYWLRKDARTIYQLGVNAALVAPQGLALNAVEDGVQLDPLNPKQWRRAAANSVAYSVLELPAASPQPWIVPQDATPRGEVQEKPLKSTMLNNDRPMWVYTPPRLSCERSALHAAGYHRRRPLRE